MPSDDTNESAAHPEPVAVAVYETGGEAEVAQAKLAAYGIESAIDDQVEGGLLTTEGEPGVIVEVRPDDAEAARDLLAPVADDGVSDDDSPEA